MSIGRRAWPLIGALVFCSYALVAFDWAPALTIVANVDFTHTLLPATGLVLALFVLRALRWMLVTQQPFTLSRSLDVYAHVVIAMAAALPTPFQIGEALKMRFSVEAGVPASVAVAGFVLERVLDLAVIVSLGILGTLVVHGETLAAIAVLLASIAFLPLLPLLLPVGVRLLRGTRFAGRLPDLAFQPSAGRLELALLVTLANWIIVIMLWQMMIRSVGVDLKWPEATMLVSLVSVVSVASMIPGGIGVAEVSIRVLMISFGTDKPDAAAAAIAVRILTPLMAVLGLLHVPLLLWLRCGGPFAIQDRNTAGVDDQG